MWLLGRIKSRWHWYRSRRLIKYAVNGPQRPDGRPLPTVVAAAIKMDSIIVASIEPPLHHEELVDRLVESGFPTPIAGIQGFLTNDGRFVDRKVGMAIAVSANQIIKRDAKHGVGGYLYSEDIWAK